jgi:hypothetical protein
LALPASFPNQITKSRHVHQNAPPTHTHTCFTPYTCSPKHLLFSPNPDHHTTKSRAHHQNTTCCTCKLYPRPDVPWLFDLVAAGRAVETLALGSMIHFCKVAQPYGYPYLYCTYLANPCTFPVVTTYSVYLRGTLMYTYL